MNKYEARIYLDTVKNPFDFYFELEEEDFLDLLENMRDSKRNGVKGIFWFKTTHDMIINFDIQHVVYFSFTEVSKT